MRVILMALLICGLAAGDVQAQTPPQIENLPPSRRVTDRARPDFGYSPWLGTELTVVVVFGADCKPCEESMPFYKKLATLPGMDRKARRLVFLTEGGVWPVINLIEKHPHGFKTDRAVSYPGDDRFGLQSMPTLLIFDGAWKRRGEWRGRLAADKETEVLTLIDRIAAEAKKGSRQ